uniref:Uncharacterized protein n=1 Tax=Pseudo-nitzschia australis TaxID=44445 RepID=A0A7S4ALL9_9STRA|mmetsp:Transcript_7532/g.16246  ORF Transcript_7532/g.16246 Transcript_7532/m.16246 type:complete len:571 (+) Transcript_7532:389-2101(+)|eukprot:CAMPEP_0168304188 /NCGR_PEP_ID=MMETSP0142_2-20121227/45717_1 /TAXON_ID=44445 /ORGANISM="Pseudo-nitzschia australis, Strain 10249 10 AB" /LENGTH=570 /DNA_ID=CAMNT_0008255317 /DNA_START=289 /DNA_END=2001 /DNA_ORIENTATION=-
MKLFGKGSGTKEKSKDSGTNAKSNDKHKSNNRGLRVCVKVEGRDDCDNNVSGERGPSSLVAKQQQQLNKKVAGSNNSKEVIVAPEKERQGLDPKRLLCFRRNDNFYSNTNNEDFDTFKAESMSRFSNSSNNSIIEYDCYHNKKPFCRREGDNNKFGNSNNSNSNKNNSNRGDEWCDDYCHRGRKHTDNNPIVLTAESSYAFATLSSKDESSTDAPVRHFDGKNKYSVKEEDNEDRYEQEHRRQRQRKQRSLVDDLTTVPSEGNININRHLYSHLNKHINKHLNKDADITAEAREAKKISTQETKQNTGLREAKKKKKTEGVGKQTRKTKGGVKKTKKAGGVKKTKKAEVVRVREISNKVAIVREPIKTIISFESNEPASSREENSIMSTMSSLTSTTSYSAFSNSVTSADTAPVILSPWVQASNHRGAFTRNNHSSRSRRSSSSNRKQDYARNNEPVILSNLDTINENNSYRERHELASVSSSSSSSSLYSTSDSESDYEDETEELSVIYAQTRVKGLTSIKSKSDKGRRNKGRKGTNGNQGCVGGSFNEYLKNLVFDDVNRSFTGEREI